MHVQYYYYKNLEELHASNVQYILLTSLLHGVCYSSDDELISMRDDYRRTETQKRAVFLAATVITGLGRPKLESFFSIILYFRVQDALLLPSQINFLLFIL
jgi:hypothetical protein